MENESAKDDMQQIKNQLREEQDKYVLAITGEKDHKFIKQIREKIVILQKQLDNMASGGYRGL